MEYLYFIRAGKKGPIKIGITWDLDTRIAMLQTGNHEILYLMAAYKNNRKAVQTLEKELHKKFNNFKIHGEWFKPHPELIDFVLGMDGS